MKYVIAALVITLSGCGTLQRQLPPDAPVVEQAGASLVELGALWELWRWTR